MPRIQAYSKIRDFSLIDEEVQIAVDKGAQTRDDVERIWKERYPHTHYTAQQIAVAAIWKRLREEHLE